MGIVLNWTSNYPASIDDQITNFPTVTNNVHDVMASHVNELAGAVIALQGVVGGLRLTPIASGLAPLDGDTLVYNAISGEWEAASGGGISLQSAYTGGSSIAVAGSTVGISNSTDTTHLMTLTRTFAGAGDGIRIVMGAGTTGDAINVTTAGVGADGIVVTDGTDTITIRGDAIFSDQYLFSSSVTSGLVFTASNKPTLVVAGAQKVRVESSQTVILNQLWATDGTALLPAYSFASASNYGMWRDAANSRLSFSIAGNEEVRIDANGLATVNGGSAALPAISMGNREDGFYSNLTGFAYAINGNADVLSVDQNQLRVIGGGSAAAPGYAWTGSNTNMGMYRLGTTVIGLSVAGTSVYEGRQLLTTDNLAGATIATTVQQGASENYSALRILVTETSTGTGGAQNFNALIDARVGGTPLWTVDNTGTLINGTVPTSQLGGTVTSSQISWPLLAPDGLVTAPSYSFSNETNSGFFTPSPDNIAVSTGASERMRWANTAITTTVPVQVPVGSSAAPTLVSTTYPTTGLYWSTSTGTVLAVSVDATPVTFFRAGSVQPASNNVTDFGAGGRLWRRGYFGPGSVGLPGLIVATGPTADTSGFWAPANHEIAISTRGREITRWADQEPVGTGVLSHVWHSLTLDGSSLIAGDAWKASTITIDDSGGATGTKRIIEYSVDSDGLGADVVWAVDETGTLVVGTVPSAAMSFPLLAPDGIVTAPSYSFASDPNTGIYRYGEGAIGFALNSSTRIRFADAGIFFAGNPTGNAFVINSGAKATDGGTGDPLIITAEWGGNAGVGAGGAGAALQLTAGQGGAGSGALAAGSGGWAVLRGGDAGAVGAGAGGDGGRVVLRLGAATGAGAAGRFDFTDSAGSVVAYMKSTGVFLGPDGGVGEPTYGFTSAGVNNSGLYLAAANVPAISSNGSEILRVESAGIRVTPDGNVSSVAVSVGGETGTGLYQRVATELTFAANGTRTMRMNVNDVIVDVAQLNIQPGTAASPSLTFETESTMGLYRVAAGQMGLSIDGSLRFFLSTSGIYMSGDGASYNFGSTTSPAATASRSTFFRGQTGYAAAGGAGGNGGTTFVTGGTGGIGGVGFAPGSGANLVFTAGAPGDPNGGPGGALGGQITINHGVDNDGTVRDTTWYAGSGGAAIAALKGTGLFRVLDGSTSTPSLSFLNDTNTGMYLAAADTIGFSTNGQAFVVYPHIAGGGTATYYGTQTWFDGTNIISTDNYSVARLTVENSIGAAAATTQYRRYMDFFSLGSAQAAIALGGLFQAGAGSASAPSLSFLSDDNTGIYNPAGNVLGFATSGTLRMQLTTTALENQFGSSTLPSYSFIGDEDTGMYRAASNAIGWVTQAASRMVLTTSALRPASAGLITLGTSGFTWGTLYEIDGSAAAPSITFGSDPDTGMYWAGSNAIGFSTGTSQRLVINGGGQVAITGSGTAASPTLTWGTGDGSDDTGLFLATTDTLGIATGGNEAFRFTTASGQALMQAGSGRLGAIYGNITTGAGPAVAIGNANSLTASSGEQSLLNISGTVNQSSAAAWRALDISVTATAEGSGGGDLILVSSSGTVGLSSLRDDTNAEAFGLSNHAQMRFAPYLSTASDEAGLLMTLESNKSGGNWRAIQIDAVETAAPGTDNSFLLLRKGGTTQTKVNEFGGILTTDGSDTFPAFSFLNSTNTGLFLFSTGTLGFATGGSAPVTISSTTKFEKYHTSYTGSNRVTRTFGLTTSGVNGTATFTVATLTAGRAYKMVAHVVAQVSGEGNRYQHAISALAYRHTAGSATVDDPPQELHSEQGGATGSMELDFTTSGNDVQIIVRETSGASTTVYWTGWVEYIAVGTSS